VLQGQVLKIESGQAGETILQDVVIPPQAELRLRWK
jgi:hypothetical protein